MPARMPKPDDANIKAGKKANALNAFPAMLSIVATVAQIGAWKKPTCHPMIAKVSIGVKGLKMICPW